ncbi:LysM peptidoglycan-binding domain-containing protein [Flavobacterium sp. F-380]|uniref:LysM peptidoglycan-binding domain-containing protein n=1 Tax=Flavobacterium kayseriense TaxID=2764714 RepID=A0ABR7J2S0_9FLAO|nr:peptidoglycan endopeptidase [Flavobacterium kayseriense]MBC5839855.1 LysM peptidoglycan-binding domain-containing protein [Flavobacterium kayseriense]MBC5847475.1 LysM peptidoglycan-binding domain-containing protein [Flavobacterium kayseriense]
MKYNNWVLSLVFLVGFTSFSQEKYLKHTVAKGETISKIAQQYHIKANAIYDLNPDARNGIKFKSILLIPNSTKETAKVTAVIPSKKSQKTHAVLPKETIYGIAKQYGLTVADLYNENPTLEQAGLRKGGTIKIPITATNALVLGPNIATSNNIQKEDTSVSRVENNNSASTVVREVLPSETKYAIAREYGISVSDIEAANPILATETLKIGQQIIIPAKLDAASATSEVAQVNIEAPTSVKASAVEKETTTSKPALVPNAVVLSEVTETEFVREVLAKETKYAIAKEYGISVAELERQNPKIKNGLPVGYQLNIRSKKTIESKSAFVVKDVINNPNVDTNYDVKAFHGTDFLDQLVSTASENIGTRYRPGGTTKAGFDCSGLMCTTFGAFDIDLPRTSLEQSQYGTKINNDDAQKGDLIFFKTNGRGQVNHVGMVVEVNDGDIKFIHASNSGVIISSIKEKYYSKRVTQINRVL